MNLYINCKVCAPFGNYERCISDKTVNVTPPARPERLKIQSHESVHTEKENGHTGQFRGFSVENSKLLTS